MDMLTGKWKISSNGKLQCCHKKRNQDNVLTCGGNEVTVDGKTLTWVYSGETGTYDGKNKIDWGTHRWNKQGFHLEFFQFETSILK